MHLERITAEQLERLGGPIPTATYLRTLVPGAASVEQPVREILERVRAEGDAAVLDYTRRFDLQEHTEPRPLVVAPQELDEALETLPLELVAGLQVTIANVAQVADAAVNNERRLELPQGHHVDLREQPVGSAAVYVPGGRAPYPSTVAMGVVTARAAGVLDVAVTAPPSAEAGEIDSAILGACRLCGVEHVYRMGGAQAIAALAYGTDTVSPVDVIVGPGNLYVQEAKRQLAAFVGTDGFAGPTDLLVALAAQATDRNLRYAALDMLAQAEHGAGSLVVAVTPSGATADALAAALTAQDAERPSTEKGQLSIVVVDDDRQAIQLANAFAPEHLELIGAELEALAPMVSSAGCLFVGAGSATAFGDYVAGSNHVLPTDGAARFASMLSPRHFRRIMAEVRIDDQAAAKLARAAAPIARAEGFEWHARSMEARIGDN